MCFNTRRASTRDYTVSKIFFRFVDKFIEFLGSFVKIHLRRFESNAQFPILMFLNVLFKYTFEHQRTGNWALLSNIWRWLLTNEPRNSVNLSTNLKKKTKLKKKLSKIFFRTYFCIFWYLPIIECIFLSQGRHYDSFPDFNPSSDV